VRDRILEEIAPPSTRPVRGHKPSVEPAPSATERPRGLFGGLRALFPITASALLAWAAGKQGGLSLAVGLECAAIELGTAGALVVVFGLIASRAGVAKEALLQRSRLASIAAIGALMGQAYLHTRCEAHDQTLHLFVFHVGAVVLAAVLAPLARTVFGAAR